MQQLIGYKIRRHLIPISIFCVGLLGIVCSSHSVFATTIPSVTLTVGDVVGNKVIETQSGREYNASNYYIPVQIDYQKVAEYSISIKAASSDMTGQNTGTNGKSNVIPSIKAGESKTIQQMQNEWGYRYNVASSVLDANNNYQAIPLEPTTIYTGVYDSTNPNYNTIATDYLTLGFGASVDSNTPSDIYSNQVVVSILATGMPETIFDINTMQEMQPGLCANTTTPAVTAAGTDFTGAYIGNTNYVPETNLTDTRDGKSYTIRKLADGNCWMVQNLELDILSKSGEGSTYYDGVTYSGGSYTGQTVNDTFHLTANDTDLNTLTDFTPSIAQEKYGLKTFATMVGARESAPGSSVSTSYLWKDDGADGLRSYNIAESNSSWSYIFPNGKLGSLNNIQMTSDVTLPSAPITISGVSITGNSNATLVFQPDSYMRYGNRYNWVAATLGSGLSLAADEEAPDSICPRGWKLPASDSSAPDSFANLLSSNNYNVSNNIAGYNKLTAWPLNFMHGGSYGSTYGSFYCRLLNGYWWTRVATTQTNARNFTMNTTYTPGVTNTTYPKANGFSIRCLAR